MNEISTMMFVAAGVVIAVLLRQKANLQGRVHQLEHELKRQNAGRSYDRQVFTERMIMHGVENPLQGMDHNVMSHVEESKDRD